VSSSGEIRTLALSWATQLRETAGTASSSLDEPVRSTAALAKATAGSSRSEPAAAVAAANAAAAVVGQAVAHVQQASEEFTSYALMV